eukprot:TRINITY_DN3737_c0_g1_i1.p1 TRINITY_DN3737_c0_g1~~TRINITY_DN3737_c0_g1_i1.p1  ORF type:complete len:785 (+),score=143.31 TRINITY_DN3737_c0_g1_i1:106-2355(+)
MAEEADTDVGGTAFADDAIAAAAEQEAELDRQAQALAETALEKLPESVRALKLPKVKEGILKRLKAQVAPQLQPTPASIGVAPDVQGGHVSLAQEQLASAVPPPPPPPPAETQAVDLNGVEACGDELWFDDLVIRRALRDSVAKAHDENKILVKSPAEEIKRICPEVGRVLGAGAVLRLGGSLLGGYSESDISYAYRQLSRALHPDKNLDVPEAPDAFKRLSDAADELRQSLAESRGVLTRICAALGRPALPEMLERPQEALFAEATRLLTAVVAFAGEGRLDETVRDRAITSFTLMSAFAKCNGQALFQEWCMKTDLLDLFSTASIRLAYDCSPKRFRAQFISLLNRAAVAEAHRQRDCVRSNWSTVMAQFPEMSFWREFLDQVRIRVLTVDEPDVEGDEPGTYRWPPRPKFRNRRPSIEAPASPVVVPPTNSFVEDYSKDGDRSDPVCWNFVTKNFCRQGERCRYLHRYPPGYDVDKANHAIARGRQETVERNVDAAFKMENSEVQISKWASWWREAIRAVLPLTTDSAALPTQPEVRALAVALWRDIAAWVAQSDSASTLDLFRAETSDRCVRLVGPEAEWAFVPSSDLLLIVGEGIVGMTCEGVMVHDSPGFRKETFLEVSDRLNTKIAADVARAERKAAGIEEPSEVEEVAEDEDGVRAKRRRRSRSRDRDRAREREKDNEKDKEKDKEKGRDKNRERDRDRDRDRDRPRNRDKERDRERRVRRPLESKQPRRSRSRERPTRWE